MKILSSRRFALWWILAREWFESKFSNIKTSTPYITEDGGNVVFNYFTPKQMAEVYMWLEDGLLNFEIRTDEEGQYSLLTKSDIQELDGMFIMGGEGNYLDTIVDTIPVYLNEHKVSEVRIEGIDADLLDADFTWKLAEIGNKLDNIKLPEIDTTELAKQGDNPDATNSNILDEVRSKLTPLEAVLTELDNGKKEMVDALVKKNVLSSTDKTLSALASDVLSIEQSPITIEGGEMYEKQLFGAPTDKTNAYEQPDTPTWNLYQVMANLLSDGRFVEHGGIMLAEYDVDSDSITLNMAGAGGAYLTSDGAMYDVDTTHTWDIKKDGKLNRWVAYIFKEEWKNVSLTHSNILSIHIGRKVGIITCTLGTKMNALVVTDGNMLKSFNSSGYCHRLVGNVIIKNIDEQSGILLYSNDAVNKTFPQSLYIKANKIVSPLVDWSSNIYMTTIYTIRIECEELNSAIYNGKQRCTLSLKELYITARKINTNLIGGSNIPIKFNPNFIIFRGVEEASITGMHYSSNAENISDALKYIYIGYDTNDKTKSVSFTTTRFGHVEDVELQYGWCKPFTFNPVQGNYTLSNLIEENIINHILKRLKQDEEMCGSGVTITLGATNLAKLTSEEAVALLDSLTNIYGYTFA